MRAIDELGSAAMSGWNDPEDQAVVLERVAVPVPVPVQTDEPTELVAAPSLAAGAVGTAPSVAMAEVDRTDPAPALPTTSAAPGSGYRGESAVDAPWLARREAALVAVRADYEAAHAQALASGGSGPGWIAATLVTDESGQTRSATGATLVHLSDPNAQLVVIGWDEGAPVYQQAGGQWLEFSDEAFAAHYRAEGGGPLQALAASYDTDAVTLLAQHPDIWGVATHDHELNAGPAPSGHAMGDAGQLAMLDLYMADPHITALIGAYGGSPAPATGGIALEQVRVYGTARYEQLSRLGNAMQSVRAQYTGAMAQAQASGSGPGWVERGRTVVVSDESGAQSTQPLYVTDESGQRLLDAAGLPQAVTERVFDPDAFTAWYVKQDGLQTQAFADFYGASHTQFASDESGRTLASNITFDNPNWSMGGAGGAMAHRELLRIDPNSPPDLNNNQAVGFDLDAGWATPQSNLHQDRDWFETAVQLAIVAVVSYVSAGTLGPEVAGAFGMTTAAGTAGSVTLASGVTLSAAGVVVSAAVAGAATSVVSGMMNDNLTFKSVLQGALAGGLTAGLLNGLGDAARSVAGPAGTIALRTTVQGGIQALLGGDFKDGALAGFAAGLADVAGATLQQGIDKAVAEGSMSTAEGMAARGFARMIGSAIRAAGNPDDPSYGFASALLNDVVQRAGASGTVAVREPAPPDAPVANPPGQINDEAVADNGGADTAPGGTDTAPGGAQTFPVGGPGAVAGPPLSRETLIDGRLTESVQYDATGQVIANYRAPDAGGYTLSLGEGYALVRSDTGELRVASLADAPADALDVVAGPGQTLVGGGSQLFVLPADASAAQVAAAGAMALAFEQRASVMGAYAAAAAEWLANGAGRAGASTLLEYLAEALPRVLGVAGLVFAPGNFGQDTQTQDFGPDIRLITRPGERLGTVEFRVTDDAGNEQWLRMQGPQVDPAQAAQLAAALRTSSLSPEEIARALRPITTPLPPPMPSGAPPLPLPADDDPGRNLPGTPADQPAPATLPGYAIEPAPTFEDLLIDKRDAKILGESLEQAGEARPEGYEAHHIVPSSAGDARMDALRTKLGNLGIDLNSAANGVWLPGPNAPADASEAYHRTLNNQDYNVAVLEAFVGVSSSQEALDVLQNIKTQLQDGTFPGVRPRP